MNANAAARIAICHARAGIFRTPRAGRWHRGTFKGPRKYNTKTAWSTKAARNKLEKVRKQHILGKMCAFFCPRWGGLGWRKIKCHFHFSTGGSNNNPCILYTATARNEILLARANLRGRTHACADRHEGDI